VALLHRHVHVRIKSQASCNMSVSFVAAAAVWHDPRDNRLCAATGSISGEPGVRKLCYVQPCWARLLEHLRRSCRAVRCVGTVLLPESGMPGQHVEALHSFRNLVALSLLGRCQVATVCRPLSCLLPPASMRYSVLQVVQALAVLHL
jgi:hypothetical protein